MSFNNRNGADPKKVYSILDRPPVHQAGGPLDKEGYDSYWGKSLTVQSDEQNANIHFILDRYQKTGQLPNLIKQNPVYGDFSSVPSYQESLNIVLHAQQQFAALDAKIRSRFGNDPKQFLEFASNPSNLSEMVKLGLAIPKAEQIQTQTQKPASNQASVAPATPPAAPAAQ